MKNGHWHLFLDDEREVTDVFDKFGKRLNPDDWTVARSTEEAKQLVSGLGLPESMALDHDLGISGMVMDTTMVFLRWLAYDYFDPTNKQHTIPSWRVHSGNPVGAENIIAFMTSWERSQQQQ
jgi:hypothetical protein